VKHTLLLAALFLTTTPATTFAQNILVNPGFETGSLAPWFANTGNPQISNANAHTGTWSVAAFGGDEIRQNFDPITTSSITEVSFWVQRNGGPFDQFTFYYSDNTSEDLFITGTGDQWQFFNVTSDLDPGKSLTAFSIFGTSSGPAFLDDFTIAAAVPEPSTYALLAATLASAAAYRYRRRWLFRRKR
jgi:hypothetical protein